MKERPILFSAPMVRAILAGTKTQTRRVVKPRRDRDMGCELAPNELAGEVNRDNYRNSPYTPGYRLWVRESMRFDPDQGWRYEADGDDIINQDYGSKRKPFTPSIHMPRSCSRILLEIVTVRVERLHEISEVDALYEGAVRDESVGPFGGYVAGYRALWESINGPGSWAANPWVWVVEFRRLA